MPILCKSTKNRGNGNTATTPDPDLKCRIGSERPAGMLRNGCYRRARTTISAATFVRANRSCIGVRYRTSNCRSVSCMPLGRCLSMKPCGSSNTLRSPGCCTFATKGNRRPPSFRREGWQRRSRSGNRCPDMARSAFASQDTGVRKSPPVPGRLPIPRSARDARLRRSRPG